MRGSEKDERVDEQIKIEWCGGGDKVKAVKKISTFVVNKLMSVNVCTHM